MASELLTAILSHGVALSTINDMLFAMFFSFFICIKLGLAPFFYWKISLLKNVYYEPACFYVIFYFSVLLTVLVKTLLLALFGFYQIAVMLYAISVFSVMSLIVFNTASATVAKFFAYSSAINGAIVLLACAAVLANS